MRSKTSAGNGQKSNADLLQMQETLVSSFPANLDKDEAIEFVKNSLDLLKSLPATDDVKNAISVLPKNPESLRNAKKDDAVNTANLAMSLVKSLAVASSDFQALAEGGPSTDLVSELNNIDFAKLIGGPLQAAVKAQADSAMTTVNFVREVGFTPSDDGKLDVNYVDFYYEKEEPQKDADGKIETDENGNVIMTKSKKLVKVPILAMLPIPSLRIEEVNIDFNVKLNSVETSNTTTKLDLSAEVGYKNPSVNLKVTASYQRASSSGIEVKKEYSMNVKVRATQDEMPAGLEKILNLLSA